MSADICIVGLAVMGENLALNFESKGFTVAVYNRTAAKTKAFVEGRGANKKIIPCYSIEEVVKNLKKPRKIMLMVRAGEVVDHFIDQFVPHLEKGDILIDGGNSNYKDTNRRVEALTSKGILFVGTGVSGGEEGALHGPSLMPGGNPEAWPHIKDLFQKIAAKVDDGTPCCEWVGEQGAGHFVKMVHNGIEYGDMQLIAESYHLLQSLLNLNNEQLADIYSEWNKGELDSFLIEITANIFRKKDDDGKTYVIDTILDAAGQKGTGKWTVESALDLGQPLTLIGEAVFARCLSSLKKERMESSKILVGPTNYQYTGDKQQLIDDIRDAIYASKIISYAQGYILMKAAAAEYKWNLNFGGIALMWRGGCIIRSKFLAKIKEAFDNNPSLSNLLFDSFFQQRIAASQAGWRRVVAIAVAAGIPIPAISSALAYYDGIRTARLPANLIQAQRDYFGAHTYERVDKPGQFFHTNWTGFGGSTVSTTYTV